MSESDSGQLTGPDDGWPFGQPDLDHSYPDLDAGDTGSSAQPYTEWHHDEAAHGDAGLWGYPQNMTRPARWPEFGTYVPDPSRLPGQYSRGEPEQRRTAGHRRAPRFSWRPAAITALLAAVTAAVTVITFPGSGPCTATDPGASTTSGKGVMAIGGHPSPAQGSAVTTKQAEQVVPHYWKVNNEANEPCWAPSRPAAATH
jgi:hypothetical protein